MIHIERKPEPHNFDKDVRQPGMTFLKKNPNPTDKQFNNHAYWRNVLHYMGDVYNGICAYSALYINSLGSETVDHFIPKTIKPELAYEWSNFRYASRRFNTRKGTHPVLDPFEIGHHWLWMDFSKFIIKPNPFLSQEIKEEIRDTIEIFGWNEDEKYIDICRKYLIQFCKKIRSFELLKEEAPFIASELKRQGLTEIEKLKAIMDFPEEEELER